MAHYYIELNGIYIREFASYKRASGAYLSYAKNPNNVVRIWHNGDIVMETSNEE